MSSNFFYAKEARWLGDMPAHGKRLPPHHLSHPSYPNGPGPPCAARTLLQEFIYQPGHQFWDDTISLVDSRKFTTLPGSKNLTDYYLLALAIKNSGKLVTFDQRIDPSLL